jgi:mannose-6-phosphate isomerase-like protein (cupin superfamily)
MTHAVQIVAPGEAKASPMRFDRGMTTSLVDGRGSGTFLDAHVNVVNVGSADGPFHRHRTMENFYLVLAGTLSLRLEDGSRDLPAGTAVCIPPGVPHSASNHGDVPLELLEIYTPASALPDFEIVENAGHPAAP